MSLSAPESSTCTWPIKGNDGSLQALDVAVVIVSYRTAELASRSIRSLEKERSEINIRVLVVDNDSGDYPQIAQAIERNDWSSWVTVIKAPRNGGFAYGNNFGIRHLYAVRVPDYIYLLNPDAEVRSGGIAMLARFLQKYRRAGIAGSEIFNVDGSAWSTAFRFPSMLSELEGALEMRAGSWLLSRYSVAMRMGSRPQQVDWISGASMMIRPAVIATIGSLDENFFLYFEETDFCFRARQAGFETWYVPSSQVMHIRGQSTGVTDLDLGPRRMPAYWFESRRRFFANTYGLRRAIVIDLAALLGHLLGAAKRRAMGRSKSGIPYFLRDFIRYSIILPRNRSVPPIRTFYPRSP
jgi:N-acetylglucosaminyl-diphospho-decaprenol L-rhamnosyltransferase